MAWASRALASRAAASSRAPALPADRNGSGGSDSARDKATSDVPASVHEPATKQLDKSINWLIAALTAVAATMVAGSQLSSIGQMSWQEDRTRLSLAVAAIVVAVVVVVLTIGLLCWAQGAPVSNLLRLDRAAKSGRRWGQFARLRRYVAADHSLHAGRGSLAALLGELEKTRSSYHQLDDRRHELSHLILTADADQRRKLEVERKTREKEMQALSARLAKYRLAATRVSQLDKFLQSRTRYRYAVSSSILAALLATPAFILFAWAANPPDDSEENDGPALAQRSVVARLILTQAGFERYALEMGPSCAEAARSAEGIGVLALRSDDAGVEVVVLPAGECAEAARLIVRHSEGSVLAEESALPSSA